MNYKVKGLCDILPASPGDVDFQPEALQILVDRMKKNPGLGAACGRIHPIGAGKCVCVCVCNCVCRLDEEEPWSLGSL